MFQSATFYSRPACIALFLFLVLLFIRFPFFFRDYMDKDESTFILMGQSIADGYLPYSQLWDLKPPLLFYLFGLIEYIFPDSLAAIRVFGMLFIFGSALLLMAIAKRNNMRNGPLIALSYVILSSMFGSVQGVMSEHIAVFFMLAAVFTFLKKKTAGNLLLSGFLLGCTVLCKMNYAYAVAGILLYYFIANLKPGGFFDGFKNSSLIFTGFLAALLLAATPYIINNRLDLFIDSVFLAPYEYGRATGLSAWEKLEETCWLILLLLAVSFLAAKKTMQEHKELFWITLMILLATTYTFYSSGVINGHYLLQLYPFIALLVLGIILSKEFRLKPASLILFLAAISIETWIEYYRLGAHAANEGSLYNGKAFDTVDELKKRNLDDKKIFFSDYHIGYWLLDDYPLTKSTTHPSNIGRPFLFKYFDNPRNTTMEELRFLIEEIQPDVLVARDEDVGFVDGSPEENYMDTITNNYFDLLVKDEEDDIYIWVRDSNKPYN